MVDEYAGFVFVNPDDYYVQIPLWSMNTLHHPRCWIARLGSDSSMVDEYLAY